MTPANTPAATASDKPADKAPATAPTKKYTVAKDFYVANKHYAEGDMAELTNSQAKRLGDAVVAV